MRDIIAKDLAKYRAPQLVALRDEFNRNAAWAGYFFYGGPEAEKLHMREDEGGLAKYEKRPKAPKNPEVDERLGLHVTVWHEQSTPVTSLPMQTFLKLLTEDKAITAHVVGYADDGHKQALAVRNAGTKDGRFSLFIQPANIQPHISVSWEKGQNPAWCGAMDFTQNIPDGIPRILTGGRFTVVMRNSFEMNLDDDTPGRVNFRKTLLEIEKDRMRELAAKLPPEVVKTFEKDKALLATQFYDTMTWETLKKTFISNGVMFNEDMAKLYACYLADTTDSKMPTRSEVERKEDEEEAKYDKKTDEEWENGDDDEPVIGFN